MDARPRSARSRAWSSLDRLPLRPGQASQHQPPCQTKDRHAPSKIRSFVNATSPRGTALHTRSPPPPHLTNATILHPNAWLHRIESNRSTTTPTTTTTTIPTTTSTTSHLETHPIAARRPARPTAHSTSTCRAPRILGHYLASLPPPRYYQSHIAHRPCATSALRSLCATALSGLQISALPGSRRTRRTPR